MYGTNPTIKSKRKANSLQSVDVLFCESCLREMKVKDKCEMHQDREPCYYCHLVRHHIDKKFDDDPKKKSSRKESPVQQT